MTDAERPKRTKTDAPAADAHHHPAPPDESTSDDPMWWTPYAVLVTVVLVGAAGFFGAFNGLAHAALSSKAAPETTPSAKAPAAPSGAH